MQDGSGRTQNQSLKRDKNWKKLKQKMSEAGNRLTFASLRTLLKFKLWTSRLANQNDDYTSLYWNPNEAGEKSENEYEVVEEGSRYFGGGILRGIRESILRELRRDLAR